MAQYKVFYKGYYIVEADDVDDAMNTDRDDCGLDFEERENLYAEEVE